MPNFPHFNKLNYGVFFSYESNYLFEIGIFALIKATRRNTP